MNGTIEINGIKVALVGQTKAALCRYHDAIMAALGSKPRNIYDKPNKAVNKELWAVDVAIDRCNGGRQ